MMFDVLILGAGLNNGKLRQISDVDYECLIDIEGKPMVEHVIQAVSEAEKCGRVALVGPEIESPDLDYLILDNNSFFANLQTGVEVFGKENYVLFVTSDIPLLTGQMIDEYISLCLPGEADFFYPIIPREITCRRFPEARRTYMKLKEGTYTGGNLMLMKPEVIINPSEWLKKMIAGRKKPWKMVRLLGMRIIVRYLTGCLSLNDVEERIQDILGYRGVAIETEIPEIGFDVDKPEDLKLVRDLL
ncbi:MAG: NTP transferase domain-containing protein [Halanaerobiales bacterium]